MPLITLATNVPEEKIPEDFNEIFSTFLSEIFQKPSANFGVLVTPGSRLTIGGSSKPGAMIVAS